LASCLPVRTNCVSIYIGCVVVPWHFKFYILKCKNFLIDFLDEIGNFKQKIFYTSKCNFFFTFYNNRPIYDSLLSVRPTKIKKMFWYRHMKMQYNSKIGHFLKFSKNHPLSLALTQFIVWTALPDDLMHSFSQGPKKPNSSV